MRFQFPFWRKQVFSLIAAGCILFVILTAIAMLFYPGGTASDPATIGYSFFTIFLATWGARKHATDNRTPSRRPCSSSR